jgi:nucleoside 2-deoxyribosyltransferase
MTKTYQQAPTTPEQEALFEAGYRIRLNKDNFKVSATAPDGIQVYSGGSVPEAWTYCDIHAHPEKYQVAQKQPAPTISKVYFAGSIRGGRELQPVYNQIIIHLKKQGYEVLSEHVGSDLSSSGESRSEQEIYVRDIAWINEADAVIADVTTPSLGVGYEVAYAQFVARKPVLCVAQAQANVSAMIAGSSVKLLHYQHAEHLEMTVDWWLMKLKAGEQP